jgi:purine-binding chemotaxis protein CheW
MAGDPVKSNAQLSGGEVQLAVFKVGGEEFAVDIMEIMEIIRPQKITKVPKAPAFVEGIINLRGKIVPVLEMRGRFGGEASGDPKHARIIIVKVEESLFGIVVDEVSEVMYLSRDLIDSTPDAVKGVDVEYLKNVGKVGDRLILILDTGKLLTKEEIRELRDVEGQAEASEASQEG